MTTPREYRGYFNSMIRRVQEADSGLIGVRLGLVCISNDVPVERVSTELGVSRQTIYSWFIGKHKPTRRMTPDIEALIEQITRKVV